MLIIQHFCLKNVNFQSTQLHNCSLRQDLRLSRIYFQIKRELYSLGLPELAEGLRGEEAGDEDEHQGLADEAEARLVQLRDVHRARVHRAGAVRQVGLDALRIQMMNLGIS